ncbi:phage tail fiber protein [Klebsiella quasivariicola]|uniref:phage tail fiber domain-containing protein n=1 Tax=Klebsiella quasivariicola TaxID=2026240 RepID=UPI0020219BA1|nr:phage tail fiber protein [Klebsiella quasivariicola]MCL7687371.1 phage tail fiber protein [Klebsiella quasivariicola]
MTVSTQVSRNEYTGNGATTQYDFTFRILDKSHLLVQMLDTSESIVTLTLGTDYTVTGVNRYNGGKVVLTSALPAGYKISIERSTPVTQEASIRNQGGFFPEIHEDAFDKLTMLVQQAYGWWSGLSLRKPSWLANYYDALNNRIRNLRDPSQAQDAATKGYADNLYQDAISHSDSNFKRTLRSPEPEIEMLPGVAGRKNKILAFNDQGNPISVLPESGSAADVMIELASGTGTDLIGFQEVKLTDELKKISGLKSLGYAPVFPMGFDSASYGMLYQFKGADVTHLFRGSIHAGKNLFGIRNNACVTSFRAGNGSEDQGMWNSQVTGVSNNLQLAKYGSPDKVGAYGDIAGTIQKAYQAPLPAVSFTANGFYTANTEVLNNAKVGMIMYTDESPRKWNIIASIDKSTGLITGWDNWADSSAYGTPATGSNVTVDPEGKLWTLNYNLILPSGGRANQGVIAELGLLNQNGNSSNVNGIDLVNLPQSTSDGDTALLIRGGGYSGSKGWLTGASIRGYKNYGLWFAYTPEYVAVSDMRFSTASNVGIQFTGGHATYSMTFALGGGGAFKDYLQTILDPKGFTVRSGRFSASITGTATLSANIKCYRLSISSAATITLPNTDGLSAGHCQELLMYRNTAITIKSFNGTTMVSIGAGGSYVSQSWTPTAGKRYILDWDGNSWKIWE